MVAQPSSPWATVGPARTVLAVVHNVTAATRLLDVIDLAAGGPRVQLDRLARDCAEASEVAVVAGDPCLVRMLASRPVACRVPGALSTRRPAGGSW